MKSDEITKRVVIVANEKNLKPLNQRTKSEQRAIQQKGGIKSGEARRRKKALRECMMDLLDLPVTDRKYYNNLCKLGISADDMDNRTLLVVSLFSKAIKDGDVAAFKEIRDLIGENGDQSNANGELEQLIQGLKDADI